MDKNDYYAILDSPPTATVDELRAAYKRLAFQHHPDHSQDSRATQHMQLLNEAYEVLSNPEKKARYDQERIAPRPEPAAVRQAEPRAEPQPVPPESPAVSRHRRRAHEKWLRSQLKIIARVTFLVTILFFWTLFTGELHLVLILIPVLLVIYLIAEIIFKIRRPV